MSTVLTLKPRKAHSHTNVEAVNSFVQKILNLLHSWEPIRLFPKSREIQIAYDQEGIGSITIKINFLCFTTEDDISGSAVIKMMKSEGLDKHYYLAHAEQTCTTTSLIGVNNSLKRGYGYPTHYFPELEEIVSAAPASYSLH